MGGIRRITCCCCPPEKVRPESILGFTPLSLLSGLSPLSLSGIPPDYVQVFEPEFYVLNEQHEDELNSGGGPRPYPSDPNYPEDPRSDPLAYTPIFRGGQNYLFDIFFDKYTSHGLDVTMTGTPAQWYDWDGVTTFPPWSSTSLSTTEKEAYRKAWYDWVFPNKDGNNFTMRGLKQLYEASPPFADITKPTVREYEVWNDRVLNLFRQMCGLNPATPLQELFIMCMWTEERKTSTLWDSKYPGTFDSAYGGPCVGGTNLHCGTTFKPSDLNDQAPYWNDYYTNTKVGMHPLITLNQGSEAVIVFYNGNATHGFSRTLRKLFELASLGSPVGGHSGTFAFRQYYGMRSGRSKWAGTLQQPPSGFSL